MRRERRAFLADVGMGVTGLALGTMLAEERLAAGELHFAPRAKSVIWIFLSGGYSHLETFDPKPALNKYAGMTFDKTPFENPVNSPLHRKRFRSVPSEEINIRDVYPTIFPMQVGWQRHGDADNAQADIAAGFQQAVVDTLVIKCRRAMQQTRCGHLVIAGGVGANLQLRDALSRAGKKYGWGVSYPRIEFCTDNGAMIAYAGYHRLRAGAVEPEIIRARPRWPLAELGNDTWTEYSSKT